MSTQTDHPAVVLSNRAQALSMLAEWVRAASQRELVYHHAKSGEPAWWQMRESTLARSGLQTRWNVIVYEDGVCGPQVAAAIARMAQHIEDERGA